VIRNLKNRSSVLEASGKIQLTDAKARFSAVVDLAVRGRRPICRLTGARLKKYRV